LQESPKENPILFQKTMKPSVGAQTGILKINMTPTKAFVVGDVLTAKVEVDVFAVNWHENESCMVEMIFPDALCYIDSWSNITHQDWPFIWWEYETHDAVYAIYLKNVTLWYVHDGFYGVNVTIFHPRFGYNEYYFSDLIQIKSSSHVEEQKRTLLAQALNTELLGLAIIAIAPVFAQVVDSLKEFRAEKEQPSTRKQKPPQ
jgi:hypothetical protein